MEKRNGTTPEMLAAFTQGSNMAQGDEQIGRSSSSTAPRQQPKKPRKPITKEEVLKIAAKASGPRQLKGQAAAAMARKSPSKKGKSRKGKKA